MNSHHILFKILCSIGENKTLVHVIIDQKNNSIHLHLHGDIFGNKRKSIQVINSSMSLTAGKEADLTTQLLKEYFSDQRVEIRNIEKLNDKDELNKQAHPLRIIIRLAP